MRIKLFFEYMPFAVALFTFFVFAVRCGFRTRGQALWLMALLACAAKFLVFHALGGDAFVPELPAPFIWIYSVFYCAFMLLCVLAVLTFFWRFRFKALVLPLLALGLAAWGVYEGVRPPQVEKVTLVFPQLPKSLDGYRIVQISDTHVSSSVRKWRTERIVETANALDGDLLVMTGDIVDGYPRERQRDVRPLKDLKAKDGVYFITGNHEFYYPWFEWKALYDQWGFRFLRHETVRVREDLVLGGVDDPVVKVRYSPDADISPQHLFDDCTNGEFRVLLQHRPLVDKENNVAADWCDLQLSGHTHGGIAPGLDYLVGSFYEGYVRGAYRIAEGFLYVCPGAGEWAGFPERYLNPCVITEITLRRP